MALEQFRPTIWSRQLIVDVDKAMVFRNVVNTKYEGEIAGAGSVVKINEIGDITVNDYSEDTDITVQTLTDAQRELVIDQKKYFAFQIDDVAKAQANVEIMRAAMSKAGHAIANTIDQKIAAMYTEAGVIDTTNLGTNVTTHQDVYASSGGSDGILGVITNMEIALNENDVPNDGRFIVWPSWAAGYLKYVGLVDNIAGDAKPGALPTGGYGTGYLGSVLGFNHYVSNNVSNNGTAYRVMFGTQDAISFAGQVSKIEATRREKRFADLAKGLYVYGVKVVRPDHLGVAYLDPVGLSS